MGQLITIDNITFNYEVSDAEGLVSDEENLGFNFMTFPPSMAKTFLREMGDIVDNLETGRKMKIFPHEFQDDMDYFTPGSEHDCNNADTQIVFMHHFFNKQRKYNVPYRGSDVYWLFHDSRHAKCDVYDNSVGRICSRIEHERLIQGAELAKMHEFSMQGLTLFNLQNAWKDRWKWNEGDSMQKFDALYFYNMLSDKEKFKFDMMEQSGIPRIIQDWEFHEYLMYQSLDEENE